MLKPALQLKLGQQLTMTPQLQQAIRLLQLPVLELQAQIREALESNVMLEAEDETAALETPEPREPTFEQYEAGGETAAVAETPVEQQVDVAVDSDSTDAPVTGPSETPWSGDDDRTQEF